MTPAETLLQVQMRALALARTNETAREEARAIAALCAAALAGPDLSTVLAEIRAIALDDTLERGDRLQRIIVRTSLE